MHGTTPRNYTVLLAHASLALCLPNAIRCTSEFPKNLFIKFPGDGGVEAPSAPINTPLDR